MRGLGAPLPVVVGLGLGLVGYPLVSAGWARDAVYDAVATLCLGLAVWGLSRQRSARLGAWVLVVSGFAAWVGGDVVSSVEQNVLHLTAYPAPSDLIYMVGYALLSAGLVRLVRTRGAPAQLGLVLDATIVATGTAVVAGVFVITPIAQDSTLDVVGKLTSSFYPVADIVLLAILLRMWAAPGGHTNAFRLLSASLAVTMLADAVWDVWVLVTGDMDGAAWMDELWLLSFLLIGCAAWSPSLPAMSEPGPGTEENVDPRRRVMMLTGGLLLPALTLVGAGLTNRLDGWPIIAGGSLALSALVVTRMFGLLRVVRTQAVRLAALARSDSLTGAPNRRTWDHELSRACQAARDSGEPLSIALLDLDHFKHYNDTYGHLAGDLVLREATAAWTDLLHDGELLARYGGEEFTVLLPGHSLAAAKVRIEEMLQRTPNGQTFSAGVALWDPTTEPSVAVSLADNALYEAKRAGRARVHTTSGTPPAATLAQTTTSRPASPTRSRPPG